MTSPFAWLMGAGVGVGAMYYFDAAGGRRRRAAVRDQVVHAASKSAKALDVVRRDAAHRIWGTIAEIRGALRREHVSDGVLLARVRSKLGRATSHPSAIEVRAENGCVSLFGPVLADEISGLLRTVSRVRGVQCVENHLHAHPESSNIAALQGDADRPGPTLDVLQENWSPTTRMAVGAAGAALMATCLASRKPWAVLLGTVGFGLTVRALTNLSATKMMERAACSVSHGAAEGDEAPHKKSRRRSPTGRESNRRPSAEVLQDWQHGALP